DTNADGTDVQTHIVFVGGLGPATTKDTLKAFFGKFGKVVDCTVVVKGRAPGMGFVHFDGNAPPDEICAIGMHQIQGKWVEVRKAVPDSKTGPLVLSGGAPARRAFSPTGGSRSVRDELIAARQAAWAKRGREPEKKNSRKMSSSSSSSSSKSSDKKGRKRKKAAEKKGKRRSSSSSSSSVRITSGGGSAAAEAELQREPTTSNPEVEKAKHEAFQCLVGLKGVVSKDMRMKEYRELLRKWHPDKNPERVDVATAVFQFLQKGKSILE
ncbi:unnamed protein product, partial [Polarella glacialis]